MEQKIEQKTDKRFSIFRLIILAVGAILVIEPIIVMNRLAMNFGVIMPLVIGTPLVVIGIFYDFFRTLFKKNILGRIIKIGMITVYSAFFCLFAFTSTLITIEGAKMPPENADVLIVLGSGLRGERVSLTLARRLNTAAEYLIKNENTMCIVSGGQADDELVSEAYAMKKHLVEQCGIDSARIIEEAGSYSTKDNFDYSKVIIGELFGENATVVFVTTHFHVFRAERTAKKCGVDAVGIGSPGVAIIMLNDYMRECAAITQYFLLGKV